MLNWLNELGRNILGLIILAIAFALVGAPYYLAVKFPDSGGYIASIAAYSIPWIFIFLLIAIFNESLKEFFYSISRAIDRIQNLSAGSTRADFIPHQGQSSVGSTSSSPNGYLFDASTANHYYFLYVYNTIFGSQVELLKKLTPNKPNNITDAIDCFSNFQERLSSKADYKFEDWLSYLTVNQLATRDRDELSITDKGVAFLKALEATPNLKAFPF